MTPSFSTLHKTDLKEHTAHLATPICAGLDGVRVPFSLIEESRLIPPAFIV